MKKISHRSQTPGLREMLQPLTKRLQIFSTVLSPSGIPSDFCRITAPVVCKSSSKWDFQVGRDLQQRELLQKRAWGAFSYPPLSPSIIPLSIACHHPNREPAMAGRWVSEWLLWGCPAPLSDQAVTICWHVPPPDLGRAFHGFLLPKVPSARQFPVALESHCQSPIFPELPTDCKHLAQIHASANFSIVLGIYRILLKY